MFMLSIKIKSPTKRRNELLDALKLFINPVAVVPGYLQGGLHEDVSKKGSFLIVEEWQTREDMVRRVKTDDFKKLLTIIEMSITPPEIRCEEILNANGIQTIRRMLKMGNLQELTERADVLSHRDWDLPEIKKRFNHLVENGIPKKQINREETLRQKQEILDRVQSRAEEYCYLTRSCAKGSALALLEEFGLGNMDVIKAMTPFPGLAMTGGNCGPVSGGLAALGLFFSHSDLANSENFSPYIAARTFIERFEKRIGSLLCAKNMEQVLGRFYDPFGNPEDQEPYFHQSGAPEKCPVLPGLGAKIAAEIIIESFDQDQKKRIC